MDSSRIAVGIVFALLSFGTACDDPTSATDLHPEGPPKIMQVRMTESYSIGAGLFTTRTVFGFGTHPMATADQEHAVTSAAPLRNGFRIIMSELLRGNRLEEINCRYQVDDDAFQPVPDGATPDDIARCSTGQDVLPTSCPGSNPNSVCICQKDNGCPSGTDTTGNPIMTAKGQSVGVLDVNLDGAADFTQLIQGSVALKCGSIDVPIDLDASYWNPSGNQQVPAQGGFDVLGPAIKLVPSGPLPTNLDCSFTFSDNVIDKNDKLTVCAPPDGDWTLGCTPGDTALAKFHTEAVRYSPVQPMADGTTGVSRTEDVVFNVNTTVDVASLSTITILEGATSFTAFTVTTGPMGNSIIIHPTAATGFAANTMYTVTIPVTVTDTYRQPAPAAFTLTFTTGA